MTLPEGTETLELDLDNGLHMRAYSRGAGPRTVLLLHGFPELALSWTEQLADVPAGFRLIAPDLRGYGGTDAPKEVREYRIEKLVGDVLALARAVDAPVFDLVGHDWGGAIAWEVARRAPEHLRTLSILNCPPGDLLARQLRKNPKQLKMSWYVFLFQIPGLPQWIFQRDPRKVLKQSFQSIALRPEIFTDERLAPYIEQVRSKGLPGIKYYRAAVSAAFDRKRPPKIELPTRVIWGLGDGALGPWFAEAETYRHTASQLDIVRIPEAGHWVQQEAPEQVNRALHEHWLAHG